MVRSQRAFARFALRFRSDGAAAARLEDAGTDNGVQISLHEVKNEVLRGGNGRRVLAAPTTVCHSRRAHSCKGGHEREATSTDFLQQQTKH